jgi:anti-anti-sigma factor
VHALRAHAARGARIVVDLAGVTFMDCGSLHELMSVRAQARRAGGDLVLAGPQPIVLRLLSLVSAADMIGQCPVFASVHDAVNGGPVREG